MTGVCACVHVRLHAHARVQVYEKETLIFKVCYFLVYLQKSNFIFRSLETMMCDFYAKKKF